MTEDEREEWVQKLAASAMISGFKGTSIVCALRRRGLVELGEVAAWADHLASTMPGTVPEPQRDVLAATLSQFASELRRIEEPQPTGVH